MDLSMKINIQHLFKVVLKKKDIKFTNQRLRNIKEQYI